MNKKKLIYFTASLGYGGLEKTFIDLSNAIYEKDEYIFEVILFEGNKISKFLNSNIKIIELKKFSRFNFFAYFNLFKILENKIVHTHGAKATSIVYFLSKVLNNIIHIGTKHNTRKAKVFNHLKYVTAVSKQVAETINNSNIKIIYNGIKYKKIDINKKLFTNDSFNIITVGRLEKIKGFDILINEFSKISTNYNLYIIGEGKEEKELLTLIKDLGLTNKIKLLGFKENVCEYIQQSNLVIISSLSEGFNLVAIETLFYGNLLISTNVGISEEILDKTFLIEHKNFSSKIIDIIEHKTDYYNRFKIIKNNKSKYFLLDNIIKEYINFYKEVCR